MVRKNGFSFAFDWLREWRIFSGPITKQSKAKTNTITEYFRHWLENCSILYIYSISFTLPFPFLYSFTCACAQKAKQKHYKYFGIEYYGECWSGVPADYSVHGRSGECKSVSGPDCTFRTCDEDSYKPKICVGGQWALYVYKIKECEWMPGNSLSPSWKYWIEIHLY